MQNVWDSTGAFFVIRHKDSFDKYPKKLRRVAVWDDVNQQTIELITSYRVPIPSVSYTNADGM
ncbi:MAG: hypothetical protein WAT79_13635 [Saprospiraceae bacterium]